MEKRETKREGRDRKVKGKKRQKEKKEGRKI